jgi:GxxExxY protein
MHENEISSLILKAAFEVHTQLGPGLLESAYEHTLGYELTNAGLLVRTQAPLPLVYKNIRLEAGYRLDMLVENKVVIELKSVDVVSEVHLMQLVTYLKLSGCKLGLLLNFNVPRLKEGIYRRVNGL